MLVVMIAAVPVVVAVAVMFGKASAVGMSMAAMFDRQRDIKAVRLRNLFQRLPERSLRCERKILTRSGFPLVSTCTRSTDGPDKRNRGGTPSS